MELLTGHSIEFDEKHFFWIFNHSVVAKVLCIPNPAFHAGLLIFNPFRISGKLFANYLKTGNAILFIFGQR